MDEAKLIQACVAAPDDDTPRRVLADYYESVGEAARAEYVRVQLVLEPVRGQREIEAVGALHRRERELRTATRPRDWIGRVLGDVAPWATDIVVVDRRGLPQTLSLPAVTFVRHAASLRAELPTVRHLVLQAIEGHADAVAATPELGSYDTVELGGWYRDASAEILARSPALARVRRLVLWLDRRVGHDHALVDSFAEAAAEGAWARVDLWGLEARPPAAVVEQFDQRAGRDMARRVQGFPERFSMHPDIGYGLYPGRLPGEVPCLAAAIDDHRVEVLTFDAAGRPTDRVLDVALPGWSALDSSRYAETKAALGDALGFRPHFVRVRGYAFPGDSDGYRSPSWRYDYDRAGLADDDVEPDRPGGIGSEIFVNALGGEYVVHWEHWASDDGLIHST